MVFKAHFILTLTFLFLLPFISQKICAYAFDGQKISPEFAFINNLQGLKKGDKVEGIKDLKIYLERFGYLNPSPSYDDQFDVNLESAIKAYQLNFNLNTTGILDPRTVSTMMMPRCGLPDIINGTTRMRSGSFQAHHVIPPGRKRWPKGKRVLSYVFIPGTRKDLNEPFRRAALTWQPHTPFKFQQFTIFQVADIKVSFKSRDHGAGAPFDGPGGILAYATLPPDGIMKFDADENWTVGAHPNAIDMQTVTLHELGHILGLGHSSVQAAIMFTTVPVGATKATIMFPAAPVGAIKGVRTMMISKELKLYMPVINNPHVVYRSI